MTDLSAYSDAELMAIAGGGSSTDLSGYSDSELMQIAGIQPQQKPLQSPSEAFTGGISNILSGVTFGFGDEILAGAAAAPTSILSYLTGNPMGLGEAYNTTKGMLSTDQERFREENPVTATLGSVAGSLRAPVVGLASKLGGLLPAAKTLPQAVGRTGALTAALAGEGALMGGAYGFGEGEGSIADRLSGAVDSAKTSGIVSGVLGAPLAGLGEVSALYADEIANLGKSLLRRSTGARGSDYAKTAKELDFWDIDDGQVQSATKLALDKLDETGVLGKTRDPEKMLANVLSKESKLTTDIDSYIREADKAGKKAAPTFDNALNYLAEGKLPADEIDKYLSKIENLSDAIKSKGKNAPLYVQQQKIAAGSKFDPQDGAVNGFWRSVYQDLQGAVEEVAPEVGALNQQLRDIKITKPIFQRGLGAEESKNWVDAIFQRLRTSGAKTITAPAIAASAALGTGFGVPAAALAAGAGFFMTPQGQVKLGSTLKKLANNSGKPISSFENLIPTLSGLSANANPQESLGTQAGIKTAQSRTQSESPSFNSKLDSIVNQQVDKAMKTPEIVSVKRTSSKIADDSFIDKEEGGQRLKAYNPPAKGSGITVSTGVDLGQWSKQDLENAGVSSKVISKVKPYLGLKDATARAKLKEQPLTLTKAEADELDSAVKADIFGAVETKLKDKGVNFAKLPPEAQTVIQSISYNFGKNFDEKLPTIWKAIVNKDWSKVQSLLINTKWKQPELLARRKREAELLSRIV